eukprot:Skav210513  [mRNA]  locus=scaffold3045:15362:17098:+ [translate_table: standard]
MAKLEELWQALRDAGLETLAPQLLQHGVRCRADLQLRADDLLAAGIRKWQLELLLAGPQLAVTPSRPARRDLPQPYSGRRASLQAALAAGRPNERKRSLDVLDSDVLARSTNPTQDARVRTYLAICQAWEVEPWPLSIGNLRSFGASLKMGGYRSAAVYFQAVCSHQQRHLRTPVSSLLRYCIRDCVRSILRGLGATKLKDSFDALLIGNIQVDVDDGAFDFDSIAHIKDMVIICLWYMLRESEMANACLGHLTLQADEAHLLIPIHKTDGYGRLTSRALRCSCGVRAHNLCVWHACERHLIRLQQHPQLPGRSSFPLFPTKMGHHASKADFIQAIRKIVELTGTSLTRLDPSGKPLDRFSGHALRVAGAQMLARAGVGLDHIQLLGRWSSQAVLRYTQDSALAVVPDVTQVVAGRTSPSTSSNAVHPVVVDPPPMARGRAAPRTPPQASSCNEVPAQQAAAPFDASQWKKLADLQQEMMTLKQSLTKPDRMFVFRPRAKVLHLPCTVEVDNPPSTWRTRCGWAYGLSNFWRTTECPAHLRKCKKCFDIPVGSDSEDSSSSEGSHVVSTDGDSSSGED